MAIRGIVERGGVGRTVDALDDPGFVLDVITGAGAAADKLWSVGCSTFSVSGSALNRSRLHPLPFRGTSLPVQIAIMMS